MDAGTPPYKETGMYEQIRPIVDPACQPRTEWEPETVEHAARVVTLGDVPLAVA